DAKADGKWFRLHVNAARVQHFKGVARAVPDREHHVIRRNGIAAREAHAAHLPAVAAAFNVDIDDLALKADLSAQLSDRRAHVLDHRHQPERADVWFAEVENFLGRARLDELRQHFAPEMARVLDLAVQLAVRERAGAAFAELHVRFRIELRFPPEFPRILGALAHFLAALEHDRTKTHLRQQQRREQTTRAESYHHRAERQPHGRRRDELI